MKKKIYVTTIAVLFFIAPVVAGADEPQPTETLPCHTDHAATTTETTATETTTSQTTGTETETTLTVETPPQATVTTTEAASTETTTTEIAPNQTTETTNNETVETNTTAPRNYPAGAVIITELYPAPPTGAAEWVELWNATNVVIDLAGFALTDASGARTILEGSITPGAYFLVSNPKGKLNNDGDTIALFDPANTQLDVASYPNGIDRTESWARSGTVWFVTTTATPLGPNVISEDSSPSTDTATAVTATATTTTATSPNPSTATEPTPAELTTTMPLSTDPVPIIIVATTAPEAVRVESEPIAPPESTETKTARAKTSKSENENVRETTLAEVRNLKTGAIVRTSGVVSAPPGVFGSSTFYVAGSGIRVSLFGVSPPELVVGDIVTLEGKLGSTQGEARLAISKPEGIVIVAHGTAPNPHIITVGEISEETEGWLVTTEGMIVQKLDDRFILDDGAGSIPVVPYEATHIDMTSISIGDTVRITGIVSETSAGLRLLPRSPEDVVIKNQAALVSAAGGSRSHVSSLSVIAGLCAAALVGMVVRKQIIIRQRPTALKQPLVM